MGREKRAATQEDCRRTAFGSSQERIRPSNTSVPGPGEYELTSSLSQPQIVLMRNLKGELQLVPKPATHAVFLSKSKRNLIKTSHPDTSQSQPTRIPMNKRKKQLDGACESKYKRVATRTAVSIPGSKYTHSPNTAPGQYEIQGLANISAKKGFLKFNQVRSAKLQIHNANDYPGCGHYDHQSQAPLTQFGAPFLSSSNRNLNGVMHQGPTMKKQEEHASEDSENSCENMIFMNDNPGPGTYQLSRSLIQKTSNKRFLNFGINKERFDQAFHKTNEAELGHEEPAPPKRREGVPFNTGSERFMKVNQTSSDQFQDEHLHFRIWENCKSKLLSGYRGHFGTKRSRFKQDIKKGPGPCQYQTDPHYKRMEISSSFESKTKRFSQYKNFPVDADYNIRQNDIAEKLAFQLEQNQGVRKTPFNTSSPRWRQIPAEPQRSVKRNFQVKKKRRVAGYAIQLKKTIY